MSEYGYFSVDFKLKNGKMIAPGAKIIGLQTNVANPLNFLLYGDPSDPGDHLAWLEYELHKIEKDGGLAFVIGHIMPGEF